MKIQIYAAVLLSLFAAGLVPTRARAGGPSTFTTTGTPYAWNFSNPATAPLYSIDPRGLGTMTPAQAKAMVEKAFQQWTSIDTAKINFTESMDTPELDPMALNGNLIQFLNGLGTDQNPVIFDQDGSDTDTLLGGGASRQYLAFPIPPSQAYPLPQSTPDKGRIVQWGIVLNGLAMNGQFGPDAVTVDDMTRATVQAIGGMLGLDYSDLNDELFFDGSAADRAALPVMHPGAGINGDLIPVLGGGFAPTLDDRMAISALYPSDTFAANTGSIEGDLLLPDRMTGLQGIDVIARKVDDPLHSAVSAITGDSFLGNGGGTDDPKMRGHFVIHVPPGNYTLEFSPLRQPIGPLGTIFPIPGGSQFYQATSSPTAGPAVPAAATQLSVTAGPQPTTVTYVLPGTPPAPQTIAQVKPNNTPATAQVVPATATVTGHVANKDGGPVLVNFGGGAIDRVTNLYRITVTQRSILSLYLKPTDKVNLALYLINGFVDVSNPNVAAVTGSYSHADTHARAIQIVADPGVYTIGLSVFLPASTTATTGTDYTLSISTTPLGDPANPPRPVLNQLVLGNLTDKSADVTWVTDADSSSVAIAGIPLQQIGDPTLTKTHHLSLTGLTPGAAADLVALSQNAANNHDSFPKVYFRTADTAAATGPATLQAAVNGEIADFIYNGAMDLRTILVEIAIRNVGGPTTNVQLTGLAASPGWKLAVPVTQPLMVGGIGTNGTAIVAVRLLRDGTGPAPLATVTGTGSYTGAGGAPANFNIGP